MYSPPYNQVENRAELLEFMRSNNFPVLVTGTGGVLHASHLPVTVHEEGGRIVIDMHMAKNNPQWKEFFDDEVLVIFSGPHAYVSPRWYEEKERVPTWNYAAVHAYGVPSVIKERDKKHAS
jgi:transcriptional regulator